MSSLKEKLKIFKRIEEGKSVRVVALGSSSTEHFMVGSHWFDFIDIGFMHTYRRWTSDRCSVDNPEKCLNAGTSNNTTSELLARFDRDVASFQPDLVILLTGINDANPSRHISTTLFEENLKKLREKVNGLGGDLLFMTFHPCDPDAMRSSTSTWADFPAWADNLPIYVECIRKVAGDLLIDNYSRWERLRNYNLQSFRLLMRDSLHLNPSGNAVLGLHLLQKLELTLPEENLSWIRDAVFANNCMDLLEMQH